MEAKSHALNSISSSLSGRLPYTIAKSPSDYSAQVLYTSNVDIPQIPYSEGLFIDYKHFDAVCTRCPKSSIIVDVITGKYCTTI